MKTFCLLMVSLFCFYVNAQVGVNNTNPDQMLDVNGKVKIGTDGKTPTEGTMRYTNGNGFEGYDANGWSSFTQKTSTIPSNPIPVTCFMNAISSGSTVTCQFYYWTGGSFSTVPTGKYLIVTGIYPSFNSGATSNDFYALSIASYSIGGSINYYSQIRVKGGSNESPIITGDQAPLLVVRGGETLRVSSYSTSTIIMGISIRGFLVDDLNY